MQQTYSHLLTFTFEHKYFRDELFKQIELTYADGMAKFMTNLGLIVKAFPGGWHLLATEPELLDTPTNDVPLRFLVYCKDPQYINYTELPTYSLKYNILYFNNLSTIATQRGNAFKLQKEEFIGQAEIVQISHGELSIPNFSSNQEYQFTDSLGNELPPQCIKKSANNSGGLMLSNLSQGLVIVRAGKQIVKRIYYYPQAVWKKPFGILEIYTSTLLKHFREKGKIEYAVKFGNRQTIWKYFLVSSVYQKFNNLSIINKGKEQIFSGPEKQPILENTDALVFESKNKIPLSEISEDTYQMVENFDLTNKTGKIVLKNLPKASPVQLYRDETKSNDAVYSHIYI